MKVKDLIKKLQSMDQEIEIIKINDNDKEGPPFINRLLNFKKIDNNFYEIKFDRYERGVNYPQKKYEEYFKYVNITEEEIDAAIKKLERLNG